MESKEIIGTQKKCVNCGGDLVFSPNSQNLICEKCGSAFEIDRTNLKIIYHDIQELRQNKNKISVTDNQVFKCPNCGSNVILNKYEVSKKCPYCDTSLVIDENAIIGFKPDTVIPFQFDEKVACEKFIKNVKKKLFIPNKFKKKAPDSQIKGIYIPTFAFNAHTNSSYIGELYNDIRTTKSNGETTTHRSYFKIKGNHEQNFVDEIVECSSKLTQSQLSAILPYKSEKKEAYDDGFIRGYCVEHYNEEVKDCEQEFKDIAEGDIKRAIVSKYHCDGVSYLKVNTEFSNEQYIYNIVPVYRFDYKYQKKSYITYMNGQTGRVDDNVPKSKVKIALTIIFVLLLVLIPIIIGILGGCGD